MEQCADLANDKLSSEVSSSGPDTGAISQANIFGVISGPSCSLLSPDVVQVVSLHDSVAALKEKLDQCGEVRAELVTAR